MMAWGDVPGSTSWRRYAPARGEWRAPVDPIPPSLHPLLLQLATARAACCRGARPTCRSAGRQVLVDWQRGRLPYYAVPPATDAERREAEAAGSGAPAPPADQADSEAPPAVAAAVQVIPRLGAHALLEGEEEEADRRERPVTEGGGLDEEEEEAEEDAEKEEEGRCRCPRARPCCGCQTAGRKRRRPTAPSSDGALTADDARKQRQRSAAQQRPLRPRLPCAGQRCCTPSTGAALGAPEPRGSAPQQQGEGQLRTGDGRKRRGGDSVRRIARSARSGSKRGRLCRARV